MNASFGEFFEAVWSFEPYPWQVRLAAEVEQSGWPAVLDIPTGAGKTAVLDVAFYHLLSDSSQRAPRRIVIVVDRRVIVDQVAQHAERLREAIDKAATPATREARQRLRAMVGDDIPLLEAAVLRGGVMQADTWAHYPHVPVLAASTVDQVGSRLLFRGYGLSSGIQPLHAGLLGCDTLFLLDEVHLARPFADTLNQLGALRGSESEVPRRTAVVQLSATPGLLQADAEAFRMSAQDQEHPRLRTILTASKPAKLVEVKVRAGDPEVEKRGAVANRAAREAGAMVAEGRRAVAVVVNRVDTARRVWSELELIEGADRYLVTGRMRPLDQREILGEVRSRVIAGREADDGGRPIVLVATQTIEAGADFDFDGLVTECASLDALRQRFGRLDRRGECERRIGMQARAVIIGRSDTRSLDDPVYGSSVAETWKWLGKHLVDHEVDFSIEHLRPLIDVLGEDLNALLAPFRSAPVVLPTYLEQWAQTNPRPHADPDVALFLHGIPEDAQSAVAEVQVIWRSDVTVPELSEASPGATLPIPMRDRIAAVPPGSMEALSLPIWTLKRWLTAGGDATDADELSDVEGVGGPEPEATLSSPVRVIEWRGYRDSRIITVDDIKPGMTVLMPSARGGIGAHGTFDPAVSMAVSDFGDIVQLEQRGRPTLRLDDAVWPMLQPHMERLDALDHDPTLDLEATVAGILDDLLGDLNGSGGLSLGPIVKAIGPRPRVVTAEGRRPLALGRRQSVTASRIGPLVADGGGAGGDDDESFAGAQTGLRAHLEGVGALAEAFAQKIGLSPSLVATLRWAGRVHDVGKVDPRFQLLLHGGDLVAARFANALAKSSVPWQDAPARAHARRVAGYPPGQRHELVSLDMVEQSSELRLAVEADGGEWELLMHLVASHHGWCRPLASYVSIASDEDDVVEWDTDDMTLAGTTAHRRDRLDSGTVPRFFALMRRYGAHELAYLEAILRLADHRQSEREASA